MEKSYPLFRVTIPSDVITMQAALDTNETVAARRNINICLLTYHRLEARIPRIPAPTYMKPHHKPEADIFTS